MEELPGELEQGQLGKLQRHQKVGFSNDISWNWSRGSCLCRARLIFHLILRVESGKIKHVQNIISRFAIFDTY